MECTKKVCAEKIEFVNGRLTDKEGKIWYKTPRIKLEDGDDGARNFTGSIKTLLNIGESLHEKVKKDSL